MKWSTLLRERLWVPGVGLRCGFPDGEMLLLPSPVIDSSPSVTNAIALSSGSTSGGDWECASSSSAVSSLVCAHVHVHVMSWVVGI